MFSELEVLQIDVECEIHSFESLLSDFFLFYVFEALFYLFVRKRIRTLSVFEGY